MFRSPRRSGRYAQPSHEHTPVLDKRIVGVLWSRTARSPGILATLRCGDVHDQAPVEGPKRQKHSEEGKTRLLTSRTWLQRTGPRRADTPRETTSQTRKVRSRVWAICMSMHVTRPCRSRLSFLSHRLGRPDGFRAGWCVLRHWSACPSGCNAGSASIPTACQTP